MDKEKINPFEYIAQLEQENEKLKSDKEKLEDKNKALRIRHESEKASPQYWELKRNHEQKMFEYYSRARCRAFIFANIYLVVGFLVFIILINIIGK